MLKVKIPDICHEEQRYILNIMLGDFLGLEFEVLIHDKKYIEIVKDNESKKLTIDSTFFYKADKAWLDNSSMPSSPLKTWEPFDDGIEPKLVKSHVPVLFGASGLVVNDSQIHINLDIFGSAFFMLSRYEELVLDERDTHNRFSAISSVAYKEGFLDRPIVNEYLEILRECLSKIWGDTQYKERKLNNFITCDVDWPFDPALYSFNYAVKKVARLVITEKKFISAVKTFISYLGIKFGFEVTDTYRDSISWMMDVNEKAGNRVAFYFIAHKTSKLDTLDRKDFDSPPMKKLFNEINDRGHEIGIHPGYETYNNSHNLKKTVEEMKRILDEEKIEYLNIGGRQHFLMWDSSKTPHLWEENGLSYDSTLSFADRAGFRCGVCYEFTMYDLVNRKALSLKQKPLIVMECSIIAPRYEGLGYSDEAMKRFTYFKKVSHKFNGSFTLLWHNSHFDNAKDKEFYKNLIL